MNKMCHIVYKITNLLNGMYYIGKHNTTTPHNMKRYWGSNKYLKSAIEIHGKENFKRETLFVFEIEEEAFRKEAELMPIELVNSGKVYNFQSGGKGGYSCSEETKQKMKDNCPNRKGKNNSMYGRTGESHPLFGSHRTEEWKKNQSEKMSGPNNPMYGKRGKDSPNYGKHHSEETKKKISENHRDNSGENHPNWGKHHTEETKKKIRDNQPDHSGHNHPFYGKHHTEESKQLISDNHRDNSGSNNPFYGKHHTEESKQLIRESHKLSMEIIQQRREDIKNISKIRGWKTRLTEKWNVSLRTIDYFIKKYASDLVEG